MEKISLSEASRQSYPDLAPYLYAMVDDQDHALVSPYTWRVERRGRRFYARADLPDGRVVYMHRLIMRLTQGKKSIIAIGTASIIAEKTSDRPHGNRIMQTVSPRHGT
jgi:hypothetical protein